MSLGNSRKVFLVVAGGNASAQRHFEDTIQRKRTLEEVRRFLPSQEIEDLEKIYHGSNFIVWGAVPGPMNESRWDKMSPGDVVLIYNNGRIRFAGEIAAKVRNKELAKGLQPPRSLQEGHVNNETVFDVALDQALKGLVDLLDANPFDVRGDSMLGAEIQYLLRLANTSDDRARNLPTAK